MVKIEIIRNILIVLCALYLITWFPTIISGFNKILKQLAEINKELVKMNDLLEDSIKSGTGARITADLLAKILASNKNNNKESKENVSE